MPPRDETEGTQSQSQTAAPAVRTGRARHFRIWRGDKSGGGFVDYQVEYRSFDALTDPSAPGGWRTDLSELGGHLSIQARIVFHLRSADPIPKGAGLLRLTVPFRERGTE